MAKKEKINIRSIPKYVEMVLVTGRGNPGLAENIAASIGMELADVTVGRFKDGESHVQIGDQTNDSKPKFASLLKNQLIETITLDEAIKMIKKEKFDLVVL